MLTTRTIILATIIAILFSSNSCKRKETEDPKPIVKVDEPKYLEWSYEVGKDPILIQIFTFATVSPRENSFDISDTTKVEDIFKGKLEGYDYFNRYQKLDMTKNSWSNQIFPAVPFKVSGHEFSKETREEIFKDLKLTPENNIIFWTRDNLSDWQEKTRVIYNTKLKPILTQKANEYYNLYKKRPKYQLSIFIIPNEYIESGLATATTFSDGNIIVVRPEPQRSTNSSGELERLISIYANLGHEFAGHKLGNPDNLNTEFADFVGKKDQFGYEVDGHGHVNGPAPITVFNATGGSHLRYDRLSSMLLFPQENTEFYSAFKEGYNPEFLDNTFYANLKLMRTPAEKSNLSYIANMVINKRLKAEKYMKEMWTDKVLVTKNGRLSTNEENATIKSMTFCQ